MRTFFGSVFFFICLLAASLWVEGLGNEFRGALIASFIVSWVIGLAPPLLIRFGMARKPLSVAASLGICVLFIFVNMVISTALGGHGGPALYFIAVASYQILRKEGKCDGAVAPAVTASKPAVIAGRMETPTLQTKENPASMNDDEFYDEVAKEMQENRLVLGVWTRAFAEADGDENRAKAIYIKLRVGQMAGSALHQETPLQEKSKESCLGNWALAAIVLAVISVGVYWMVTQGEENPLYSKAVLMIKSVPAGADATAVSWEVVNERWVRNTYANGDVTLSDKDTGRMWLYNATPCGQKTWAEAVAYCDNLTYAEYSDWRLPDMDTLKEQFCHRNHFDVQSDAYLFWSGTSSSYSTDYAWYVSMYNGSVNDYIKTASNYVWPMRGGQ